MGEELPDGAGLDKLADERHLEHICRDILNGEGKIGYLYPLSLQHTAFTGDGIELLINLSPPPFILLQDIRHLFNHRTGIKRMPTNSPAR